MRLLALSLVVPFVLVACGSGSSTDVITKTRQVESPMINTSVKGLDRFGVSPMPAANANAQSQPAQIFEWDTPDGWHEQPPTDLRLVNFAIGPNHEAECYVTVLQGEGGGLEANVNRWRTQMSQGPLTPDEIKALPKIHLLGLEATYLSIPGTFKGMGGNADESNALLLGAIFIAQGHAVFVKLVGPADFVKGEEDHFKSFCESLRPAPENMAQSTTQGPGQGTAPVAATSTFDPSTLSWKTPGGWTRGRESSMRIMTYNMGPNGEGECAVSVFPGDVGGMVANVNRWYGQMSQTPLTPDAVAALPTIEVLGQKATLVDIQGDYKGMGGRAKSDYRLIGVICPLPSNVMFFKLTGPDKLVQAEKDNFVGFCESFKQ